MKTDSTYKTKQKQMVLDYVKSIEGTHVTVGQISDYFRENKWDIGLTTIYRQLDRLILKGVVRKFIIEGETSAHFEYVKTDHEDSHYHFKCEECGVLVNFSCDHLKEIEDHLALDHGFTVSSSKTVFYGYCKSCMPPKELVASI